MQTGTLSNSILDLNTIDMVSVVGSLVSRFDSDFMDKYSGLN